MVNGEVILQNQANFNEEFDNAKASIIAERSEAEQKVVITSKKTG